MGKAKQRTPWWLLYLATAALYAALYVDWPGSAPLSDWIGWTIGALGLLFPPFMLGFGHGVDERRPPPARPALSPRLRHVGFRRVRVGAVGSHLATPDVVDAVDLIAR